MRSPSSSSPALRSAAIAFAVLLLAGVAPGFAVDGSLDPTFRGNGRFLADVASFGGKAAAVAPDGRLLIGYTAVLSGTDRDMRVMPVPDQGLTTFCPSYHPDLGGTDEDRLSDIGVFNDRVYLAGRAAGPAGDPQYRGAIAAFALSDCLVWNGFGGATGVILHSTVDLDPTAIGVNAFGGVAAAVQSGPSGTRGLISFGINETGSAHDTVPIEFGPAFGAISFEPKGIFLQPDGKRVIVGTMVLADGDRDIGVARVGVSGALDPAFSGDGLAGFSYDIIDSGDDEARAVAVLPDGRIVIVGDVERAVGRQAAVAILTPTGGFFNSFGLIGRYSFDLGSPQRADILRAVALQGDGKIVVAGGTGPLAPLTDSDFAVARLLSNGSQPLDGSFGNGGRQLVAFDEGGSIADTAYDLTLGQGGRISVVGAVATANGTALGAVRLENSYIFADGFEWGLLLGTEWRGVWGGSE